MDHPSVGGGERALEAERGEALDGAGDRRHDLGPAIGAGSPHRAGAERVEPEADVAGGGIDALALDIFGDVDRRHPRLRTDLQLDADAGIEIDAVENLRDGLRRRIQPKSMGAIGAGEHQRQPGRAIFEIVQRLRVGRFGVGMIDPLHDLPGRGRGAARDRGGAFGAAVDRIDLQPVGGLADQFLERRALQHPVDQLAPVLVGRRRQNPPPMSSSSVSRWSSGAIIPWSSLDLAGNCHGAAAKPNGCFGPFRGQSGRAAARYLRSKAPPARPDAASRNDTVGHDLGKRHQHEGALE